MSELVERLQEALDTHQHFPPGDWPCTAECAESIAAALDAQPVGLDVERLAKAICASRPPEPPADMDLFVDDECRALASRVLAALASEPQP